MSKVSALPCWLICIVSMAHLFFLTSALRAQSTTDGAIAGTVSDPSGGSISNATVTVTNNGTNLAQTVSTDEWGYFRVAKLQPTSYTVLVEAAGFGAYRAKRVVVEVGSITEILARLNLKSAGDTIVVSAEIPQVNTDSPEFAPIVNQTAIDNLPINGGRWSDFALLTPGVVNDASGFGLLSFRGMSTLLNNNTIDGADNNQAFFSEERGRTRIGYSSAKASVQEFQVNTSNYSAEYGRAAGAVINTVTKSGSNELHGEVYFYDRDNEWGATNPFTRLSTQTAPGLFTSAPYKPKDVRKIYGGGVGGPILKDRLFFFFAGDRYDRNFPGTAVSGSPNAFFAAPVADLSAFGGSCQALTTPSTNNPNQTAIKNSSSNGANVLTATLGACTLMTRLGKPDYASAAQTYNSGLNGLLSELGPVARKGQATIFFPKVDWVINSKNHASFEVNRMRWISPAGIQTSSSSTVGIDSFGNDYVRETWGVARLFTNLTSTLSNEARFQYGRDFEFEFAQPSSAYEQANFITSPLFPGYVNPLGLSPDVFITNGFDMGVPTFLQRPAFPDERRTQFADTVSWTHGKHSLKFGVDYAHTHDLSENLRFQYGSFSYSNLANYFSDLNAVNTCTGSTGPVPCYSSYQQAFGPLGFEFNTDDYAFFAEDSWRVRPRLTVNIGLRYEYEKLPDAILPNSGVPQTQHLPRDKNNVGPRIGFAWDVTGDGKTSLRGGYGIYYGRIINSTIYNALTNTGVQGGQFSFFFTPTTPNAPSLPQLLTSQPTSTSALNITFFDQHFQAPSVQQTDLTLEREIARNTVVSVSYLGSFGRSLPDFVDVNTGAPTSTITYTVGAGGPLQAGTYSTPLFATVTSKPTTGPSTVVNPRPNKNFGAMSEVFSGVSSNYNALALQLNRRMTNHLQFMASYTWAHALDYGQNGTTFSDTNDLLAPTDIHAEYGNSIFDVRNRFVASAVVETPWHAGGWLGYLTDGWLLAPIYSSQSGLPYSLVTSGTPSFSTTDANGTVTTFSGLGSSINGSNGRKGIDVMGRNTFRQKRTIDMDLRLSKKIMLRERLGVELIGEAFNIFNHQNVTSVNNTGYIIGGTAAAPTLSFNSSFGSVTNSNSNFAYSPRQIQIGARLLF
jgi:outer membrane receptor protein involved in Fe transport